MFTGFFSSANAAALSDNSAVFDGWESVPLDLLQRKMEALLAFCYPDRSLYAPEFHDTHGYDTLKTILTPDNLKHFLEHYKHWNHHWPMVHLPTFNPFTSNDGLILAMVCTGAVYSNRLGMEQTRWLMEIVRTSIYRSSEVYKLVSSGNNETADLRRHSPSEIDEIQALVLLHSLFVWHGNHTQRQQGRSEFWILAAVARRLDLFHPLPLGHPSFSAFHQPGPLDGSEINTWTWSAWVEQERRLRLTYLIFLIDASLVIYFNIASQFEIYDIQLPLPADDAAWEAKSEEDCASALGLRGGAAQERNSTGSKRPKQVGMSEALHHLHQGVEFPERATNIYSKFILMHALLVQTCNLQRQALHLSTVSNYNGLSSSGTSTPQSQTDWPSIEGSSSTGTSGRTSPTEGLNNQHSQVQHKLRLTYSALELWKRIWDEDMAIQYPGKERRIGFCRDGIHHYYLARFFLRSVRRDEWAAPSDARFRQVFSILKQIRSHVASESAQKGLDFGSVTAVDDSYGMADLTLDMRLLFTPINSTH